MSTTLTSVRPVPDVRAGAHASVHTWLGSGLIALGLGLAVVSLLGPFGMGVIDSTSSRRCSIRRSGSTPCRFWSSRRLASPLAFSSRSLTPPT